MQDLLLSAVQCAQGRILNETVYLSSTVISLDILTDLMIIAIPVRLLWQAQMARNQKLALGGSLCLSICMILIAIIRISGLRAGNSIDVAWEIFWQFMEACIAVLMVSLTAFRSLFVLHDRGNGHPGYRYRKSWSSLRKVWSWKKGSAYSTETGIDFPSRPPQVHNRSNRSRTFSMTAFYEKDQVPLHIRDMESDEIEATSGRPAWPLVDKELSHIMVKREIRVEEERITETTAQFSDDVSELLPIHDKDALIDIPQKIRYERSLFHNF